MKRRKKHTKSIPLRRRSLDPHHEREASRYEHPVASREFILDTLRKRGVPVEEGELARLIFHELAHQVVYTKDDTMFNESFAVAVERLGGTRWLALPANERARTEYAGFDARRHQFRDLQ